MKNLFIFYIILLFGFPVLAQKGLSNPKFEVMLDTLLNHNVKEILPNEISEKWDIVYLDSRNKKEYDVSHIDGAIWVGFSNFKLKRIKNIPKNKKIIVYCTVGYRSEKIAEKLVNAGYKDVYNLYGGIFEWVHQNKNITNIKGLTNEVHTFDKEWAKWLDKGIKKY